MKRYARVGEGIRKSWIWSDPDYIKAFIEIMFTVRYANDFSINLTRTQEHRLQPGEFAFGRRGWAKRLNLQEGKLRDFIRQMEESGFIKKARPFKNGDQWTIYQIIPDDSIIMGKATNTPPPNQGENQGIALQPQAFQTIQDQGPGLQPGYNTTAATISGDYQPGFQPPIYKEVIYKDNQKQKHKGPLQDEGDWCFKDPLIKKIIQGYFHCYRQRMGKDHPLLKPEQFTRICEEIRGFQAENSLDIKDWSAMILAHYNTSALVTDYNINHFATDGVLKNLFYAADLL